MMKRKITMVVGRPCVGKSAIVRKLLAKAPLDEWVFIRQPFAHHSLPNFAILGRYDEDPTHTQFPGTDRLSMSVAPSVRQWIDDPINTRNVLFEGDRLGNLKMATHLIDQGYDFRLVVIAVNDVVLKARRDRERTQPDRFLKAQATKVRNLVLALPDDLIEIRGNDSPADAEDTVNWLWENRCAC